MQKAMAEARESLYLLSIELVILYLVAFGLLALKTDSPFSVGIAYPAVLCTFLLAYLVQAVGLFVGVLGMEDSHHATMACARGAAVFMCAAFLLVLVLVASLWSSTTVCVYETDTGASCYTKGDAAWQRTSAADVRFGFPSRTEYLAYAELANATVADVFLKTSLSESDWMAKLSAVVALPVAFVLFVVQSSFFYAVYGLAPQTAADTPTGADVFGLFVRCSLLLLTVVLDSVDLYADWNVTDVGPQMLPSLAFTSLLIFGDFCGTIVEQTLEAAEKDAKNQDFRHKLGLLACLVSAVVAGAYVLFALLIACHYLVGGLGLMRDLIADTRLTTVHILFVMFIVVDACSVFVRSLWKARKYVLSRRDTPVAGRNTAVTAAEAAAKPAELAFDTKSAAHAFEASGPPFGASIDMASFFLQAQIDKKTS